MRGKPWRGGVRCGALLVVTVGLLIGNATASRAAGAYPAQPIKFIVPFGVGGLADISMRLVAKALSDQFGDHIVIDNRPGAGGVIASSVVLNAAHDGYTLGVFANGTA